VNTAAIRSTPSASINRLPLLDWARFTAIILMLSYHLTYDLVWQQIAPHNWFYNGWFPWFQQLILFLFMACAGFSLCLLHANKIHWRGFWKRELKLIACAAAVSLGTWIAYPQQWVYFGTLHCIATASLVSLAVLRLPWLAAILAAALLLPFWIAGWTLPWIDLQRATFDHIPLFPWLGFMFIGVAIYHLGWIQRVQIPLPKAVAFASRHSLWIYLAHQPLLLALVMAGKHLTAH
jgi:uncharacterized membrane protein